MTDGDGNRLFVSTETNGLRPTLAAVTEGKAQDQLTLTGRNFTQGGAGATVPGAGSITIGGAPLTATNAAALTGGLAHVNRDNTDAGVADDFQFNVRIPSGTPPGIRTVAVSDGGGLTRSATIMVKGPSLSVTPASGPAGTRVTLTGLDFPAGVGSAAGNTVAVVSTGAVIATGLFTDTAGGLVSNIAIPALATGQQPIRVVILGPVDGLSNMADATFTVATAASIVTVSPAIGPRGTSIVVSGTGFTGGGAATVAIGAMTLGGAALNAAAIGIDAGGTLASNMSMSSDYVRLSGQGKCPSRPLSYHRTVIRGTCPWCASWAGSWLRRTCGPCSCGCPTPWRLPEWRGPEA